MNIVAYRHGLKIGELIDIRLKDVDLENGRIFVSKEVLITHPSKEMNFGRFEHQSANMEFIGMQSLIIYF